MMSITALDPCMVCGSAACLVMSPDFCRTTNQHRPDKTEETEETEETEIRPIPKRMPNRKGGKS